MRGIEVLGGYNHCRTVNATTQRPQHTAETMVKRNRNTNPVDFRDSLALADIVRIQQQIAVTEHRRFRKAGRARGVLNIDWLEWLERCGLLLDKIRVDR